MGGTGRLLESPKSEVGTPQEKLEGLHRWAQAQRFNPPLWLRQADLQTMWYVIRDIAAHIRDDRISPREIWKHILGQQASLASGGNNVSMHVTRGRGDAVAREDWDTETRRRGDTVARKRLNGATTHSASLLDSEAVELPFSDSGFLTGLLNRAGASRRLAILFHGLEGSVEATYMRGVTRELLKHQIAALRVNMVNCGGSEACTRRFYHAGFTLMLEVAVQWALRSGFDQIAMLGFSLGGNLVLKYLGGSNFSYTAAAVGGIAVSAPIDLAQGAACIDRSRNKFYRDRFLKSMYRTLKRKQELFPDLFPRKLERVRTITEFDHRYTAPANGFSSGAEYYRKTSSISYLCKIDRPTLILHSQDDIFIPFDAFREFDWDQNPNLIPLFPNHGGHIGFHTSGRDNWMEKKIAEFCDKLM